MKKFDRQVATDALNALAETDPDLSASIRKMMFVFDDLATLDAATLGTILREIDFNTLAMAMKDCAPKFKEMVLKNITKRAAEGLQENLKMMANVKRKEVESARAQVMEQVFEIERRGDISLAREEANAS
jgi:flagellar motor switch protein FliG